MKSLYEKPLISEDKITEKDVLTASGIIPLRSVAENAYLDAVTLF